MESRKKRFEISMTDRDYIILKKEAEKRKKTISSFARYIIYDWMYGNKIN
jgi:hypothetical protein